jgi:membrane fusion protein, copper/silver efflux system
MIRNRKRNAAIAAGLMVAAIIAIAMLAGAPGHGGAGHSHGSAATEPEGKTRLYYCSMHPQVQSPDPNATCPICGMRLIPLPDDDETEDDAEVPRLRVSEGATALMDIRVWPVERRPVDIEVALFGMVGVDESRLYTVPARTEAFVERLFVNTPWQAVERGEALADLYSPMAVTAMRELTIASRRSEDGAVAGDMAIAARERLQRLGVTAGQIEEIERTGTAPRTFRVESPVAGVVFSVEAREGDRVLEGGLLTRIADLSRVWINLEAYERDLAWLAVGQIARISLAALPGETFEGVITFIAPALDPRTRTVRLRVEVNNTNGLIKPGLYASARILVPFRDVAPGEAGGAARTDAAPMVIPASAPLIAGERALVYVRLPGEDRPTFEARSVTLGPRAGEVYIVREGLETGDLVVVNGQFKIDSELQIRGRPSLMAAGPARTAQSPMSDVRREPLPSPSVSETPRLQTNCPIMGGEINREYYYDHKGLRIYVCCPPCIDQVKARADAIIEEHRQKGIVFERIGEMNPHEGVEK